MKKGVFIFFLAVLTFSLFSTNIVEGAVCNPRCTSSSTCGANEDYLGSCGSIKAPLARCQTKGCTPPGTPTPSPSRTCANPNTCVNSASGCPTNQPNNVSSATPCTEPGRICCSATDPSGPGGSGATPTAPQTTAININVANPLRYSTVEEVLTSVMNSIKGIVITLALLMIVIGGIMYIFSLGNPERMKTAKNVIIAALVGLAIVIAAPAFLREISALLGWNNAPAIVDPSTDLTLTQIARNILNFLLSIIGILALIVLVISGIMYLLSGGSETRMKQARAMFTAALIGITVAMASLILVSAVAGFFN